ncbi:hypothetical protein C4D60_Mb02t18070 [Musa balbisiana]|uniref:Uncharacterized protein n=1 Tax=Musa balbisiana TaxID=52838 RepID=A0A4S8IBP4_MUSBA|nr:hypothetical protein C4D60_Mb02t18070 [Musa balbisiana]
MAVVQPDCAQARPESMMVMTAKARQTSDAFLAISLVVADRRRCLGIAKSSSERELSTSNSKSFNAEQQRGSWKERIRVDINRCTRRNERRQQEVIVEFSQSSQRLAKETQAARKRTESIGEGADL